MSAADDFEGGKVGGAAVAPGVPAAAGAQERSGAPAACVLEIVRACTWNRLSFPLRVRFRRDGTVCGVRAVAFGDLLVDRVLREMATTVTMLLAAEYSWAQMIAVAGDDSLTAAMAAIAAACEAENAETARDAYALVPWVCPTRAGGGSNGWRLTEW